MNWRHSWDIFRKKIVKLWRRFSRRPMITYLKTLYYNEHSYASYLLDSVLDYIFNWLDRSLKYLGPLFVVVVLMMLLIYVAIAYTVGFAYWYDRSPMVLAVACVVGHWLLLNVSWNYYKSLTIDPGFPSDKSSIPNIVSHCKKCSSPKPPRTHHCSVCKKCILKMDHHCPWLNKCIGHWNHRYFYFFCVYTWLGTLFVMGFGVFILVDHALPQYSVFAVDYYYDQQPEVFFWGWSWHKIRQKMIVYEVIVTILLFFLLGLLIHYHSSMITNGETCIERHINRKIAEDCRRQHRVYRNPYDFGAEENWRRFLGLDRNEHPWRHILLPSSFAPIGDGFTWQTASVI